MTKTIVGLFDTFAEAQTVVQDLVDGGFDRSRISVVANDAQGEYASYANNSGEHSNAADGAGAGAVTGTVAGGVLGLLVGVGALAIPGIGPVLAAGPLAAALGSTALGAGIGAAAGGLLGGLIGAGVPEEDANYYAEGVRRGGSLVTVSSSDDMAERAYDIMQRHGAVDIDERGAQWQGSGWSRFDENAQPYTAQEISSFSTARASSPSTTSRATTSNTSTTNRTTVDGDAVLPVMEEEIRVGKRQVQGGGVRIFTHVTETPVEEQVSLREETVHVERRTVDRPITDADMAAFKEGTIEVTTTSEEAVVSKQARVVEEVVIDKDVQERTETIRDTVRRTDVDVEQIDASRSVGSTNVSSFESFDSDFRSNYTGNFASSGYTYDQFAPVYRYGYGLGTNQRYSSGEWTTVEPEARRQWEERNPGTWEQFKDAIQYSWNRARGRS